MQAQPSIETGFMPMINTVAVLHQLEKAGFTRAQAEAQMTAIENIISNNGATKAEVQHIVEKSEKELQQEMQDGFALVDQKLLLLDQKIDAAFLKLLMSLAGTVAGLLGIALGFLRMWYPTTL